MEENKRLYNSEFRKKLKSKLEKIVNKNELIQIYNIITNDIGTQISSNRNGIFININILSDQCIEKLYMYITEKNKLINIPDDEKQNCKIYKLDDIELMSELGHKLSNHEKNIIKRIKNKN